MPYREQYPYDQVIEKRDVRCCVDLDSISDITSRKEVSVFADGWSGRTNRLIYLVTGAEILHAY